MASATLLVVMLCVAATAHAQCPVSFTSADDVPVGAGAWNPYSVAIGDLNGDDTPDLAVANNNGNTVGSVSVMLGTGSGTFGSATNFTAGYGPASVAIGDLDNDGRPDLVVTNAAGPSHSISIFLNTGAVGGVASFSLYGNWASGGAFPGSVAISDFNADNKLDFAVANNGSAWIELANLSVFLNTSTGPGNVSFAVSTPYVVGLRPGRVAVGYFNADNTPDLVVTNGGSASVSILLGTGTGTFGDATNFAVGDGPISVAVGDLSADGKPDLAVTNDNFNVAILLGTGTGTFATATTFYAGYVPYSIAIGELNGDGTPDLVVTNGGTSGNASIFLGAGTGSFGSAINIAVGIYAGIFVAIGEFNGDDKPDLAVVNYPNGNVSILLNSSPCQLDTDADGIADDADNCPAVANTDQLDTDGDAAGDACDPDDDNDTVPDAEDGDPLDRFVCRDVDGDGCDDCTSGLVENAADDGTDTDADGQCDLTDPDDDADSVLDGQDNDPVNRFACRDLDADDCDDCNSGADDPLNDGLDFDADGFCDFGDADDDLDGVNDDQDANPFNRFVCRDGDGDGCDDCGVAGIADPTGDGTDFDIDGLCDAGDADDDNDGLPDSDEPTFATDPFNPDSDGDGLYDGTEVDTAIEGCPNPTLTDSDGDTLSDGDETVGGTNPCNADTDDDGLPDNVDPVPTTPGVTSGWLEEACRDLADPAPEGDGIPTLDPNLFYDSNSKAKENSIMGRIGVLASHAHEAANAIHIGAYKAAIAHLSSLLDKIDGVTPQPDWMKPSVEQAELADEVKLLIDLLELL